MCKALGILIAELDAARNEADAAEKGILAIADTIDLPDEFLIDDVLVTIHDRKSMEPCVSMRRVDSVQPAVTDSSPPHDRYAPAKSH